MGIFDFFTSKPKTQPEYINGIGELTYSSQFNEYAYRGKIDSASLKYKIGIVFPTRNKAISDYQKMYFKELERNINKILEEASKIPSSKIVLADCIVDDILIPDKENNSYDVDAEIVVSQKERPNIYGTSIYTIIMKDLNVAEVIFIE